MLPISLVEDANEDGVKLYALENTLDDLPEYKEEQYVEVREAGFENPVIVTRHFCSVILLWDHTGRANSS